MIKSILCTVDGSPSGNSALRVAVSLAGITNSTLYGLYVINQDRFLKIDATSSLVGSLTGQPPIPTLREPNELLHVEEEVEKEQEELMLAFRNACQSGGIPGTFVARVGKPGEVIAQLARSVDLLVMGNCGKHKGVQYAEQGETVSSVLHNSTRPVFVVPERAQGSSTMMIAYDGSPAAERALRLGAEFARIIEISEIHLLTAVSSLEESKGIQQTALDYLVAYEIEVFPVVAPGKAEEVIVEYASRIDPSVVVLGAYGSGAIHETVFGSTTDHVLHEVESALLFTA